MDGAGNTNTQSTERLAGRALHQVKMNKEQKSGGREGEGHSPAAESGITPLVPASRPGWKGMKDLRGCSVLETRGVRLYCCTRVGGNTASIKYTEVRSTPGLTAPCTPPSGFSLACLEQVYSTSS